MTELDNEKTVDLEANNQSKQVQTEQENVTDKLSLKCKVIFWTTAILWVPVLIVIYCLIATLALVTWCLQLALIVTAAFVGIAGVVVLTQAFWGALFYIGMALMALGLAVLFLKLTIWVTTNVVDWFKVITNSWLRYIREEA
ncbi:hypothetical protein G6R29_02010 [Fructobacillus sp. M2-14]|uniref:Transmembrane protein n=1 Tax=Fructobacillus broussonetiae TaxID=2713173 RepID=A0ABS5QZ86_9LACO|nr:hypothetical protein [Fructobacillus broussonetiae]MBS9338411.1 hypothetical protein [Fructobacillus broussonetiae]